VWIVRLKMQKVKPRSGMRWNIVFLLIALVVVVADQLSKIWIRANMAIGESVPETGVFRITHINNTGASFGLFPDQSFSLMIIAFAGIVVVLFFVLFLYRRVPLLADGLGKPALGLILGGNAGNLIDRLRLGYVTDFINISVWPVFNIADASITLGVALLVYSLLSFALIKKESAA